MEPDETKSIQQPRSPNLNSTDSKTPDTFHIPGVQPLPPRSSSDSIDRRPGFWEGLRLPGKRVSTAFAFLFILILVISGVFNLAKGAIDSLTAKQPATTTSQPTDRSQPSTSPAPTPTPTTENTSQNNCTDLPTRMAQAKISIQQVDRSFYQAYPERANKPLTAAESDRTLRQEWCTIANKLIERKLTN